MASKKKSTQVTGNVGMYYVSFCLSKMGFNVIPTSRNAKGIDLVVYNEDNSKMTGVQVKCLSGKTALPMGYHDNLDHLMDATWTIVVQNKDAEPSVYILTVDEVKAGSHQEKGGSWWLGYKKFAGPDTLNRWNLITDHLV